MTIVHHVIILLVCASALLGAAQHIAKRQGRRLSLLTGFIAIAAGLLGGAVVSAFYYMLWNLLF